MGNQRGNNDIYIVASFLLVACNPMGGNSDGSFKQINFTAGSTNSPLSSVTPHPTSTNPGTNTGTNVPINNPSATNPNAYNIGMNVPGINYYNGAALYSDVAMQFGANSGPWNIYNDWGSAPGDAAPLDSTGAPTVSGWSAFTGEVPSGDYTVTWDGTGSIRFGAGTLSAITKTTSSGVQHNTATWTYARASSPAIDVFIYTTAPTTNIHMQVPTSDLITGSRFTKTFITKIAPFTNLRFMDALNTNATPTENWSDRTWPNSGSRSRPQGMAYEDIIALANETGKDVWINIPVLATDDYVCRLGRLLLYGEPGDTSNSTCSLSAPSSAPEGAVGINPVSKVYLEFTNEIWNWGFNSPSQIYCMTNGGPDHPDKSCALTSPTSNIGKAALANHSFPWSSTDLYGNEAAMGLVLTKRNNDMIKAIFGSRSTQIKTIINVQSAYPEEAAAGFDIFKAAYGSLTGSIDYMAVAPYFNIDSDSNADTVEDIFSNLTNFTLKTSASSDGNAMYNWVTADIQFANIYNLPLIAYEGGSGISDDNYSANKATAALDPRMFSMVQLSFQIWDMVVGRKNLFNYYSLAGGGNWGSLLNLHDAGSQKYDALVDLILLPGDANEDGVIDQSDCAIVRVNYGKTGAFWSDGDFNHDGVVNAADLALLNKNITGALCTAP